MPRRTLPPEAALMLPVLRAALRMDWVTQMSPASAEIPYYQKRLDLGLVGSHGLFVVELKVTDWRRAVRQAFLNRWVADFSWVALWHEAATPAAYEAAYKAGVGVLLVTPGTAYPWLAPGQPKRPHAESPVRREIGTRGTRIRDLLSSAREIHCAAFA